MPIDNDPAPSEAIRPRVTGVLETCLHVEDLHAATRFYEELFGFARMASDERFCAFDVAGKSVLLLFRRGAAFDPVNIRGGIIPGHGGSGVLHFAFAIPAADIARWEERLASFGIAIESRVRWERGGVSLYFRDLDNHLVELVTPGTWPSY